jgi:hypothetical protein
VSAPPEKGYPGGLPIAIFVDTKGTVRNSEDSAEAVRLDVTSDGVPERKNAAGFFLPCRIVLSS